MSGSACVLLGAGATRGASFFTKADAPVIRPPLDSDFFTQAQRLGAVAHRKLAHKLLAFTVDYFGVGFRLSMEQFFTQIEVLPDFYKKLAISTGQPSKRPEDARRVFLDVLRAVFHESLLQGNKPRRCDWHDRFAQALEPNDAAITFNYDCLFEESLRTHCRAWNPEHSYAVRTTQNITGILSPRVSSPNRRKFVHLLKLHGSLNWRESRTPGRISLISRPYDISGSNPLLIPPQLNKQVVGNALFQPIWLRARRELETARHLFIVGYSLPQTDLLAQTLLRSRNRPVGASVRSNHLHTLVIANPDRDARHRFISLMRTSVDTSTRVLVFDSLAECASFLKSASTPIVLSAKPKARRRRRSSASPGLLLPTPSDHSDAGAARKAM